MAATAEELQSFYQFAEQRLRNGSCDQSLDEHYADWRVCNPTPEELERNVLAVRAALRHMDGGKQGGRSKSLRRNSVSGMGFS